MATGVESCTALVENRDGRLELVHWHNTWRADSQPWGKGCRHENRLVTDAWMPQVNGVVTTLVELVRQRSSVQRAGHSSGCSFVRAPCPGYAGMS